MEKQNISVSIFCPIHTSELIQRVDTNVQAKKHIYCVECLVENPDSKVSSSLLNISDFLHSAALFYVNNRRIINPTQGAPNKYLDVLSGQAEVLEKLTKHLNNEKEKIINTFDKIIADVLAVLNRKKDAFLHTIDEELLSVCGLYSTLEKQLKRAYPKPEDIDCLFPSQDNLNERLHDIDTASELINFVKEIKEDLNAQDITKKSDENKRVYFDEIITKIQEFESLRPVGDLKIVDISAIKNSIKEVLSKALDTEINLGSKSRLSEIIKVEEFDTIKSWLPSNNNWTGNLTLLYRGSRDGFTPAVFHSKCDNKGSTVTVIKCKFNGSAKDSIIGGFLDKEWSPTGWIESHQAFLFTLGSKSIKFDVEESEFAAIGSKDDGPCFGSGYELATMAEGRNYCYFSDSYKNSANMIPSSVFKRGQIGIKYEFELLEIEVFKIN